MARRGSARPQLQPSAQNSTAQQTAHAPGVGAWHLTQLDSGAYKLMLGIVASAIAAAAANAVAAASAAGAAIHESIVFNWIVVLQPRVQPRCCFAVILVVRSL